MSKFKGLSAGTRVLIQDSETIATIQGTIGNDRNGTWYEARAEGMDGTWPLWSDKIERVLEAQKPEPVALLHDVISAWEVLDGGQAYECKVIEHWLREHMAPAIDRARVGLGLSIPTSVKRGRP